VCWIDLWPRIGLDGPGIDAVVDQLEAASMSQHVRVDLHIEANCLTGTFNYRLEAASGERYTPFANEDEWQLRLLLALYAPKGA
jgi:hypothetical protein